MCYSVVIKKGGVKMFGKKTRILKMLFFDFCIFLIGMVALYLGIAFFFFEPHLGNTWRMFVFEFLNTKISGGFYILCGVGAIIYSVLSFADTTKYAKEEK